LGHGGVRDLHRFRQGEKATVEILLPIAAVAVGMTVLGLTFYIIANGAV
jgi:hypothetical protein